MLVTCLLGIVLKPRFDSLGGMRCPLNIPGHVIIAMKKLIKLPLTKKEKTATSDNYISNHFQIQLYFVCSLFRNMSPEKCLKQT